MRTIRRDSRRMTSTRRESRPSPVAMPRATDEGVTSASRTIRPPPWRRSSGRQRGGRLRRAAWTGAPPPRRRGARCRRRGAPRGGPRCRSPRNGAARRRCASFSGYRPRGPRSNIRPRADEARALGGPALSGERREIFRRIHVEGEAGERQDSRLEAAGARRREAVLERGLAELERHRVGWCQRHTVRAEPRARRGERGRALPRPGDECLNLVAGQARDVAGHGEEDPRPPSRGLGLSEGDRRGVARVRRFTERGEWLGADRYGELDDLGIARHDPDAVEARGAEGGQDVAQHRARELVALPGAERGDEALLGVDEVLGRHGTDDHRNGGREGGVTPWVA